MLSGVSGKIKSGDIEPDRDEEAGRFLGRIITLPICE